jgi:ATP-dependent 26S proteasome regulatory subunit
VHYFSSDTPIMEHFKIIQSLCRIGLGSQNPAFRHQVERLREALVVSGEEQPAATLDRLLKAEQQQQTLRPSRVVASAVRHSGEELSPRVQPPCDRETGAALAELHFPNVDDSCPPVLSPQLNKAVETLLSEWSHADKLAAMGVAPVTTCMLFGAPGTGKTRLAQYISASLNLPIVQARLDGLISSFLGTTARNLGNLFEFANRYKCLLLLDEFDAIAKLRDDPQEVGEIKRVVNTLLQNIDSRTGRGLTVAITNHESLLDKAVWRRFEIRIAIPVPSLEERRQIFARYLPPLDIDESMLKFLGWLSNGMTGSEIETVTKGLKRLITMSSNGKSSALIEHLQAYALTHANAHPNSRISLLLGAPQHLVQTVMDDPEIQITQAAMAAVLGRDQTTIGRWIRSERSAENEVVANA